MMFGQQPYVYQQPIYNQPPMMQEPMMRPQYQPAPSMQYPTPQPQSQQQSGGQSIIWVPNEKAANEFIVAPNNAVTLWDMQMQAQECLKKLFTKIKDKAKTLVFFDDYKAVGTCAA